MKRLCQIEYSRQFEGDRIIKKQSQLCKIFSDVFLGFADVVVAKIKLTNTHQCIISWWQKLHFDYPNEAH